MVQFIAWFQSLAAREDEGQGLVEYALIIALVSIALVAALGFLADDITAVFEGIGNEFGV